MPPKIALSGIFFVTTELAPTTLLFPIVTPGRIKLLEPIHTLSPIIISASLAGRCSSGPVL